MLPSAATLWACAFTVATASASIRSTPSPIPGALPYHTPVGHGASASFVSTNSPRLHNRALYGPHNSVLVVSGDRLLTHLGNDRSVFGGLLVGLSRGNASIWAHDADDSTSSYEGGALSWVVRDSRVPGLELRARLAPAATGIGFVLDANVSDDGSVAGAAGEVLWAHGCVAPAPPGGNLGWQLDPLIHTDILSWAYSPRDCAQNNVSLSPGGASFSVVGSGGVGTVFARLATAAPTTLGVGDANDWADAAVLSRAAPTPSAVVRAPSAAALPVAGATLWLRASTLAASLPDGSPVSSWADESGSGVVASQAAPAARPLLSHAGLGAGDAAVVFDGVGTFLAAAEPAVGVSSTIMAVFRDDGSSGGDGCCSGVVVFGPSALNGSCNGISTLPAMAAVDDDDHRSAPGHAIVTKLDYPGSNANGRVNIRGRPVIAASIYAPGGSSPGVPSNVASWTVDGCVQGTRPIAGNPGTGVMLGSRFAEMRRYFKGALAEVVVFGRALTGEEQSAMAAYFAAAHPAVPPKARCEPLAGPLAVGRVGLAAAASTTRLTWAVAAGAEPGDPLAVLANATSRVATLTRTTATTPDALVDAAVRAAGPAVDGLFRDIPGAFVHGAMAWDVVYVGWRSEYGATCLGWSPLVESEGRYFMAHQDNKSDASAPCKSDPSHLLTVEAPTSRFYGRGKVQPNAGMYDMQTQFFDQQIHVWRWTTPDNDYEATLRTALELHAAWAEASFDADRNGLFASYINTWPTDSQWYNGGETVEETAYMYRVQLALRDLALRAGDDASAAVADAAATKIAAAFQELWIPARGHPAANREEGGHKRLRPDAWLYGVFLPIEAGLLSPEQSAQALHYSEWALERLSVLCNESATNATCGEVCVTSNWVPSQWSVRQLWSGDNYALALAYFLAGLADDGYTILSGFLRRDMLQSCVPGQAGGPNGGTDFNDAVHPMTRALVEGLFGFRPDYVNDVVVIAPALPSAWDSAAFDGADVSLDFSAAPAGTTLSITLTRPVALLVVRLPIHATSLGTVSVDGAPAGATWTSELEAGWGATVLVIKVAAASGGAPVATVTVTAPTTGPLPCVASIAATSIEGATLSLLPPSGLALFNFSDPQGMFVAGSARVAADGVLTGIVASGTAGTHAVFGYAHTTGDLSQAVVFKVVVASAEPPPPPPPSPRADASWAFAPVAANADVTRIYEPGTYLSPRPETCGVRIGTDGYSAWSFTYWGTPLPSLTLANIPNITVAPGVIVTPQGAHFAVTGTAPNVLFASLWDNYPAAVNVSVTPSLLPGATTAWVLVAGSTNPMQTLLPNAELRFRYSDGTADTLELVPPHNFWSLSIWGVDYDVVNDAFAMPNGAPPAVQLGDNVRAMVYAQTLRVGATLAAVELEVMSQEVVIGIMAVSLVK